MNDFVAMSCFVLIGEPLSSDREVRLGCEKFLLKND